MVERRPWLNALAHLTLIVGVLVVAFPIYLTWVASTQSAQQIHQGNPMSLWPGDHFLETYTLTLWGGVNSAGSQLAPLWPMLQVSLITAVSIAVGKIAISLCSAFAIVYFRFPLRGLIFWMIFITLMLPVEVRILPTYEVMANVFSPLNSLASLFGYKIYFSFSLLDSYAGLTLPLIASATATFFIGIGVFAATGAIAG